jgi:hypothetical protein
LIVDESSVTAAGVLEIEFSLLIPQLGVIARQNFTIKNGIVVADFCACNRSTDFDRLVRLKKKSSTLK